MNLLSDNVGFSVIISTYNRCNLLIRTIESILQQNYSNYEIVIVDDASTDNTQKVITEKYSNIRYYRMDNNMGPGECRNIGLYKATKEWALIIDDDDIMIPDALKTISKTLHSFVGIEKYPVINFTTTNSLIEKYFVEVSLVDHITGKIKGDFVAVIQVKPFLSSRFSYPALRIGGESLLWMKIAKTYGIPTWDIKVIEVMSDAPYRLTSADNQIQRAQEYAEYQDLLIENFQEDYMKISPKIVDLKLIGSATYWLMAGNKNVARNKLTQKFSGKFLLYAKGLYLLTFLPTIVARGIFKFFRKVSRA